MNLFGDFTTNSCIEKPSGRKEALPVPICSYGRMYGNAKSSLFSRLFRRLRAKI